MAAEKEIDRVVRERFFADGRTGVLVEVGAAKPDYLSIGASFRERGWTVISIEPNPVFCAMHRARGHEVLEYACSDEDRDDVEFFVVNSKDAAYLGGTVSFESFSSLGIEGKFREDLETVKGKTEVETIRVKVRRLDTILAEHFPEVTRVDVVAVDVEGWEMAVMRGLSLHRYRPEVVILENLHGAGEYRKYMRERGYGRWRRLKPNEVYVRREGVWGWVRGWLG